MKKIYILNQEQVKAIIGYSNSHNCVAILKNLPIVEFKFDNSTHNQKFSIHELVLLWNDYKKLMKVF